MYFAQEKISLKDGCGIVGTGVGLDGIEYLWRLKGGIFRCCICRNRDYPYYQQRWQAKKKRNSFIPFPFFCRAKQKIWNRCRRRDKSWQSRRDGPSAKKTGNESFKATSADIFYKQSGKEMSPNLLNVRRKSRECEKKWQQTFSFDFLLWPSTSFLTFWLSFSRLDPVLTHRQRPVLWPVNSMHWTIMQLIRGVQQFYLYPVFGHQQETCWPHEVYNRGHKRYRLALRRCFACYKNNNDG